MSQVYSDNSLTIGRTPLVRLNRVGAEGGATILAKTEGRNPAYSVKCRIGASMIWDAEEKGLLGPGPGPACYGLSRSSWPACCRRT